MAWINLKFYAINPPPHSNFTNSRGLSLGEVPILKKTIELYKTFYAYLEFFPKKDKYALGATCERYLIQIIELLLETSYLPKDTKRASLLKANNKFEVFKVLVRLLHELKIIDQKKYIIVQTSIQEIGKMFGGWIKSLS